MELESALSLPQLFLGHACLRPVAGAALHGATAVLLPGVRAAICLLLIQLVSLQVSRSKLDKDGASSIQQGRFWYMQRLSFHPQ